MGQILYQAVYSIMRPLVRILYRKGVPFGELALTIKHAYVDVVADELVAAGQKATTSRIAVSTGLTRKDVASLRTREKIEAGSTRQYNRVVRMIGGWMSDEEFVDEQGLPATLPRQGNKASFDALVERYSGDMLPRAALDELVRVGAAEVTGEGEIKPLADAYLTGGGEEEGLSVLGTDVALLISTISHNISSQSVETRYQRKVSYDNLPEEAIAEFKKLANRENQKLLLKLNAWLAKHDRDANPDAQGSGRVQAGVGIYYFEQSVEESNNED